MDDAQDRVWQEIMDLTWRRDKLVKFMQTDAYQRLSDKHRSYLYTQNLVMESYEMILRIRHSEWGE